MEDTIGEVDDTNNWNIKLKWVKTELLLNTYLP